MTNAEKRTGDEEIGLSLTSHDASSSQQKFMGDYFFITVPWSLEYYFTVRGSENFHICLWVAKDLAWSQDSYWPAMIFGIMALAWCVVLAVNAVRVGSIDELYMLVALFMWLCANFLWMAGETFRGDDDYVVPRAGYIMEAAIGWILFYHIVLRPLKMIPKDEHTSKRYEENGLKPRFSYFENWRQYEHVHTLCWLGKDLSWNELNPYFWVICLVPTVTIAADFIWTTFQTKRMMIDTVHYLTQLMWVGGNMAWALGNIYVNKDGDDQAYDMFTISLEAQQQCRYAASWILFTAYIPIVILYCVWLPLTYMGQIRPPSSSSDRDSSSSSCHSAVVSVQHITKNEMHGHDGQQQQATIDSEQQIEMRTSSDLNSATDHDNES